VGHYFAASAFRNATPDALAKATAAYGEAHGVRAVVMTEPYPINDGTDALFYAPENGWTVSTWPNHFNIHDVRLCAAVTRALGCVAVTVNVYEGAFWSMELLESGALVDCFSPWGDYFAEDATAAAADRAKWQGNAEKVAGVVGCAATVLEPYYRYVGDQILGKASADDRFDLEDFWVFTDVWRQFGAQYPANPDVFAARVRFGRQFGLKLPTWEGEPLGPEAA